MKFDNKPESPFYVSVEGRSVRVFQQLGEAEDYAINLINEGVRNVKVKDKDNQDVTP